jgi:hypothetical protein
MAYHPEIQHHVADMRIALQAIDAHLDRICDDWSSGVDHGMDWPVKIIACKYDVVTRAWGVVDTGLRSERRGGDLQAQPLRAAVPRCPSGPHPPRQLSADARARREDEPRHQPRRTAPLGLTRRNSDRCAGM